jgi:LPXTG-motif cell wall-anchored protein
LTIADVKTATGTAIDLTKGAVVEVIYNAHLNEEAVVGTIDDNENTVYLEYSNNPNAEGGNDFGKTPEDTVWVFTYKVDSTKYADKIETGKELPGAGFTLYTTTDGTTKGNPVKLVFDATKKVYRPASAAEIAADANAAVKTVVTEMTSDEDGKFHVIGLDVGTYIMEETNVPAGYNKCADITIEITAVHEETDKDNAETIITMKKDNVAASQVDVVNKSGTVLPETGGMGTTIFYIVGGLLAVAAVVLLITKKRMNSAE